MTRKSLAATGLAFALLAGDLHAATRAEGYGEAVRVRADGSVLLNVLAKFEPDACATNEQWQFVLPATAHVGMRLQAVRTVLDNDRVVVEGAGTCTAQIEEVRGVGRLTETPAP